MIHNLHHIQSIIHSHLLPASQKAIDNLQLIKLMPAHICQQTTYLNSKFMDQNLIYSQQPSAVVSSEQPCERSNQHYLRMAAKVQARDNGRYIKKKRKKSPVRLLTAQKAKTNFSMRSTLFSDKSQFVRVVQPRPPQDPLITNLRIERQKQRAQQQQLSLVLTENSLRRQRQIVKRRKLISQVQRKNNQYFYGFDNQISQCEQVKHNNVQIYTRPQTAIRRDPPKLVPKKKSLAPPPQANQIFNTIVRNSWSLVKGNSNNQVVNNQQYNNNFQRQTTHIPIVQLEEGVKLTQKKEFQQTVKSNPRPQTAKLPLYYSYHLNSRDHPLPVKPCTADTNKRTSMQTQESWFRRPKTGFKRSSKASRIQVVNKSLAIQLTQQQEYL